MKMQAYLDTFSRFKDRAQLDELESLLIPFPQLEFFERAQLRACFPFCDPVGELTEDAEKCRCAPATTRRPRR